MGGLPPKGGNTAITARGRYAVRAEVERESEEKWNDSNKHDYGIAVAFGEWRIDQLCLGMVKRGMLHRL